MSDVTLSKSVRANLLHLQNTAKMMETTQERLATGKKVNSALDNPSNFFTAESLNARAADIGTLLDAMSNGIRTIEAADNGLTAMTKTIESMQSTLRQARQDKSFEMSSYTLDPDVIDRMSVQNLSFSGGAVGETAVDVPLNTAYTTPPTQSTYTGVSAFTPPQDATAPADVVGSGPVTALTSGDELTFSINGVSISVTGDGTTDSDADATATAIANAIDAKKTGGTPMEQSALANLTVANATGTLTFSSSATGASAEITLASDGAGDLDVSDLGVAPADYSSTGSDAEQFTITIGDKSVTLDTTNANDFAEALATLQTELDGTNYTVQEDPGNPGRLQILGPDDGTETVTVAGSSASLTKVFGSDAITAVAGEEGQGGEVKSVDDLVTAINNDPDLKGKIRASNDRGQLRIENQSTQELEIDGIDSQGAIDGTSTDAATIDGNMTRGGLAEQFNSLVSELDTLSEDASFNGVNLLRGDELRIVFNETGSSEIRITTKGPDGKPQAVNSGTLGIVRIDADGIDADTDIDGLLADMKSALDAVRGQSSNLGSNLSTVQNREDFTKEMINTLETGASNLTLADTNEEAANMLALQTRQQLSQTALSLASQADQAVLRLFG